MIPTVDLWEATSGTDGVYAAHLYFLAQPNDLPERLIGADPDTFYGHFLDTWSNVDGAIPTDVRQSYLDALRAPAAIEAVWARWATTLTTRALPGGHFLAEDVPEQLTDAIRALLAVPVPVPVRPDHDDPTRRP